MRHFVVFECSSSSAFKAWYGVMRIPFSALDDRTPSVGEPFRINLFRSQGPPPDRAQIEWRPTRSNTFHVPESFGLLKLAQKTAQ